MSSPLSLFKSTGNRLSGSFRGWSFSALLLLLSSLAALQANPAGGTVAAGAASISGTGTSSVKISQTSPTAVINWNSFSINSGELTTFLQPNSSSVVLNRVTGGSVSTLAGTLNANGQVFLINGNGILVGKSGVVNTAGFTASTQDIANHDFTSGKYQFAGHSLNGVQNLGTINALGGNVYLIGHTVDNEGTLNAAAGTVGLAAGEDVLVAQSGTQHLFVNPVKTPGSGRIAINNSGSIAATSAELQAANGNMYALAINNGGAIRATTVKNLGGHIWLTSDKGVIINTGVLDASATAVKATGGSIVVKTAGIAVQHGKILSHGGQGGIGGTVDLSGSGLDFTGNVDLTTPGGKTGSLLLDPSSITVVGTGPGNGIITVAGSGLTTTYTPVASFPTPTLYNVVLEAQLELANVIVDGVNNVTIASPVSWNAPTKLTLETTASKATIVINAPISGVYDATAYKTFLANNPSAPNISGSQATLVINDEQNGYVTTGAGGSVKVNNFTLENGYWRQVVSATPLTSKSLPGTIFGTPLPAFSVSNDFQLQGTSTFARFAGGNGLPVSASTPANGPYQIVDIYGLQGIGSPSNTLLSQNYVLNNDINVTDGSVTNSTIYWNGGDSTPTVAGDQTTAVNGAGWVPIGENGKGVLPFTGVFNGNNHIIGGYYLYRPSANLVGLFGDVSGTVKNVILDGVGNQGTGIGGLLVGRLLNHGLVEGAEITFYALQNEPKVPTTPTDGTVANQSNLTSSLGVSAAAGSVVGEVLAGGTVLDSNSDVGYELLGSGSPGGLQGLIGFAGLVGVNYGTITNCSSSAAGSTSVSITVANGGTNTSFQDNSISLGGLVGTNFGTINGGSSSGNVGSVIDNIGDASILSGTGNFYVGGFVGTNYGTIDGNVTVKVNGKNVTESYQSFTTDNVTTPDRIPGTVTNGVTAPSTSGGGDVDGGTGTYYVGGYVGANYGTITSGYSARSIFGVTDALGAYLAPGGMVTGNGDLNGAGNGNAGALGDYAIGGFAGGNFGKIINSGTEDTVKGSGNINGIGTVSTTSKTGVVTTVPATVSIGKPLALDSIFVGGFVGLSVSGSSITGSFSSPHSKNIAFHLNPDFPLVTTAANPGQTFFIASGLGNNQPLVSSDGLIRGGAGYYIVGGFAGGNYGTITTSNSEGIVYVSGTTTQSNSYYVGGLAGIDLGNLYNDYATGNVTSFTTSSFNQTGIVGGLVGQMFSGSVQKCYSLGTLTGGTTRGGLIGVLTGGGSSASFWDISSNPLLNGYSAGGSGAKGETSASLLIDNATLNSSVYAKAGWSFTSTWTVGNGLQYPTLQGVP